MSRRAGRATGPSSFQANGGASAADVPEGPDRGGWKLVAPGTTRIASARVSLSHSNKVFAHHCLVTGLRVGAVVRDEARACAPPASQPSGAGYDVLLADPVSKPTAKEAFVELEMPVCNNPSPTACSKWVPALDPLRNGAFVRVRSVELTLVDDDLPQVVPSGPLFDLAEDYTNGRATYSVAADSVDNGAGVQRSGLEQIGAGEQFEAAGCDVHHHTATLGARICPGSTRTAHAVDTNRLPEGANSFRVVAADVAGNVGLSSSWRSET